MGRPLNLGGSRDHAAAVPAAAVVVVVAVEEEVHQVLQTEVAAVAYPVEDPVLVADLAETGVAGLVVGHTVLVVAVVVHRIEIALGVVAEVAVLAAVDEGTVHPFLVASEGILEVHLVVEVAGPDLVGLDQDIVAEDHYQGIRIQAEASVHPGGCQDILEEVGCWAAEVDQRREVVELHLMNTADHYSGCCSRTHFRQSIWPSPKDLR
jgi:hypothetical protein